MSEAMIQQTNHSVMHTYQRFPLSIAKGKGSYVWDQDGNKYLDYTSGIATCNLGHVPDSVHQKLSNQLDNLWHCSNLYEIPTQNELAALLTENSCFDRVFFCNSGAEANEAAIKFAKKYAKDKGYTERTEIVTFHQSFHGRTGSTMAATAQEKIHQGFTPLTPGFRYLTLNEDKALESVNNGTTAAVLLELIQGEGGINAVEQVWIEKLSAICKEADILLMVDEVQTGAGRTGTLFAYEQFGIEPDVMTSAKGLGSGFPIGAMLAKKECASTFSPGTHGSTFGGNPLAATAGIATIETILKQNILEQVKVNSSWLQEQLEALQAKEEVMVSVKGIGFLIGVELKEEANFFIKAFREKGILVLSAGSHVLRILPPLTTTKAELTQFIEVFKEVLVEMKGTTV
ncbi:acetylornithine transaminase [Oceanobacillus profundus]|uniref:Acetylornithine aminotransferase n=1 Tax=Oceanobacillus profundus TaxID=372463 RepID=A0A417YLC8_9BACI|nr:acetylornithine transaminase [Oceanobacillus profundus]RHW34296.1 acetylornithine transaminase [Oceanobacillus profundus]